MTAFYVLIPFAYLLGSVPFGLIIANAHGKDLRNIGSGNIGATNVFRAIGKKWACVCFFLDCLKALGPMLIAKQFINPAPTPIELWMWMAVGCAAIIGHVFPLYLRFKGGKGVATSMGMVLGLFPYYTIPGVIAFAVWLIVALTWKYVSLASIVAAAIFPITLILTIAIRGTWQFRTLWPLIIVAMAIAILVVVRHAENIKRLLEGSEHKAMQK